jgi:DNA repair exonuclease SbcCD ATPase subunit
MLEKIAQQGKRIEELEAAIRVQADAKLPLSNDAQVNALRTEIEILKREKVTVNKQLHQQTRVLEELLQERAVEADAVNKVSSLSEKLENVSKQNQELLDKKNKIESERTQFENILKQYNLLPSTMNHDENNHPAHTPTNLYRANDLEQTVAQLNTVIIELKVENNELRQIIEEYRTLLGANNMNTTALPVVPVAGSGTKNIDILPPATTVATNNNNTTIDIEAGKAPARTNNQANQQQQQQQSGWFGWLWTALGYDEDQQA